MTAVEDSRIIGYIIKFLGSVLCHSAGVVAESNVTLPS
jgi:hypothetical protein